VFDENGKFVILNKEWKDAMNAMPDAMKADKIACMARQFAHEQTKWYIDALIKALEEKNDIEL